MFSLFRYDGPLMRFLTGIFDLLVLNILWLIGCIPIVTIGASTTAMYSVVLKLIRGEDYTVFLPFVRSFRENLKQATIIWLIFLAAFALLGANLFLCFFGILGGTVLKLIVLIISGLLAIPVVFVFLYVLPLQARFYNSIKQTIQNALIISLTHLPATILMVILDAAVIWATVLAVPLLSLFAGILVAFVNAWVITPIFAKYMKEGESL